MKTTFLKISYILTLFCIFESCDTAKNDPIQSKEFYGTYSGTFTVEYNDGTTRSNTASITFIDDSTYDSPGNNNRIPAGGSGTYEKSNTTITFDEPHFWTADFDWNLILKGEYDYTLNGNQLTISANKNNLGLYKYQLVKQ